MNDSSLHLLRKALVKPLFYLLVVIIRGVAHGGAKRWLIQAPLLTVVLDSVLGSL